MTVYKHTSYGGRSLLISQQNADFRNDFFNDIVSSMKITGTCNWLVYTDVNFEGTSFLLTPGDYPSYTSWVNDKLSSARVLPPAGTTAIMLFEHHDFLGRMLTLYSSESDLRNRNFNDVLGSFIITGGTWTLYQHINYGGSSASFSTSAYKLLPSSLTNDDISSVLIL